MHRIVDALIAYWFEQEMDKDHPDFLNACKEVYDSL
jgi:hypothetical protein